MEKWKTIVNGWIERDTSWILYRNDTRSRLADIRLRFLKVAKVPEEEKRKLYDYYLENLTANIGGRRGQVTSYDGEIIWIGG